MKHVEIAQGIEFLIAYLSVTSPYSTVIPVLKRELDYWQRRADGPRFEVIRYSDGKRVVDSIWSTFSEARKAALNLRFRMGLGSFDVRIFDTEAP